jgi:hypothetical protein
VILGLDDLTEKAEAQGAIPQRTSPQGKAPRQSGGGKGLRETVEVQTIMVKALWGQKMDFQSPCGLGTGRKARGQSSKNRKLMRPGPKEASILGEDLFGKASGLNKSRMVLGMDSITPDCLQRVQSLEVA